ncbi:hypothetical protein J6590_084980 [Homalodisca vitripennis]|nr:hypothetical protein J6590_084980 [Homalodisca vitripennis]
MTRHVLQRCLAPPSPVIASRLWSNRCGWPTDFKNPTNLKLKRGESLNLQRGMVISTVWRDNRDVMFFFYKCQFTSSA